MNILYIRQNFPKLSETFIMEEVIQLRKMGHKVKVLARFCEFEKLHPKVLEEKLFADVIFKTQLLLVKREDRGLFNTQIMPSKKDVTISSFFKKVIPDQNTCKDFLKIINQKNVPNAPRFNIFQWIYLILKFSIQLGNLSLAINQFSRKIELFIPDVIHCPYSNIYNLMLANQLSHIFGGIPYTTCFRALELYKINENGSTTLNSFIKHAAKIITISKYNVKRLNELYPGIKEFPVIHSSIDTSYFNPSYERKKNKNQIITVGRFIEKKGFEFLIKACSILKMRNHSFICYIIGEGQLKRKLENLIEKNNLKKFVHLIGPFSQKEIKEKLEESEIFVFPCINASDSNRDILANTIKEAMSMELPVITSNINGIEELVIDGITGLLTEPGSANDIADKIEILFKDSELKTRLGKEGREKIKKDFAIQNETEKLVRVFEQVNDEFKLNKKNI